MKEAGYQAFGAGAALFGIGIALPNIIQSFRELAKNKGKVNTSIFGGSVFLLGMGLIIMVIGFAALASG